MLAGKISGTLNEKIFFFSLVYTAVVMPFQMPGVPAWIGIAVMLISWLAEGNFIPRIKSVFSNKTAISLLALYLVYMIGLFYSSNIEYAKTDLLLKSPLLFFPLVYSSFQKISKEKKQNLLYLFLISSFVSALICGIRAAYLTHTTGENYFFYNKFSYFIHVGHYSMFLCFAAFISLHIFFNNVHTFQKIGAGILFVFFFVMIFLLSARAQMAAFLIILLFATLFYFISKKQWTQGTVFILFFVFVFISALKIFSGADERILEAVDELKSVWKGEHLHNEGMYLRSDLVVTGFHVVRENLPFGAGTGDCKDELIKKAKENNISMIVDRNLNFHNQYFQTAAAIGVPGLFFLLAGIFFPLFVRIKRKFIMVSFVVLIAISFLTESMLERQAGVLFFSFFTALLTFTPQQDEENQS